MKTLFSNEEISSLSLELSLLFHAGVGTGDALALLAVYRPYVEETYISFEYEVPSLEEFTRRIQTINERYPYLLAEQDGAVLGYAYAAPFKARAAYDWAVETTIYLRQDQRGRGIGRALLEYLIADARRGGRLQVLSVTVSATDTAAASLCRRFGFTQIGCYPKFFRVDGKYQDGLIMNLYL